MVSFPQFIAEKNSNNFSMPIAQQTGLRPYKGVVSGFMPEKRISVGVGSFSSVIWSVKRKFDLTGMNILGGL